MPPTTKQRAPMRALHRFFAVLFVLAVAACSFPPGGSAATVNLTFDASIDELRTPQPAIEYAIERKFASEPDSAFAIVPTVNGGVVRPATPSVVARLLLIDSDPPGGLLVYRARARFVGAAQYSSPSNQAPVDVPPGAPGGFTATVSL